MAVSPRGNGGQSLTGTRLATLGRPAALESTAARARAAVFAASFSGVAGVAALCAMTVVTFAYRYTTFNDFSNDHFVHLARAQQMLIGALPVRDYVDSGMPLMVGLSALAQLVLGSGLHAELLFICAAFAAASAVSFAVAVRVSGSIPIAMAAAAVPVLVFPVSYSYPKLLPYAAAFAVMWFHASRPGSARLVAVAASVVIAFLFRHDHGLLVGAGAAAALVVQHRQVRDAAVVLCRFAVAVLLLVSPYLLWIQVQEGLGVYLADGMAFSRREAEKAYWQRPPDFAIDRTRPLLARLGHGPVVIVRWVPELPEPVLRRREAHHGLTRLDLMDRRSWQYELSSWSPSALEQLVTDAAIADTHGIDRREFRLTERTPGLADRLLVHLYVPGDGLLMRRNSLAVVFYLVWLLPLITAVALVAAWRSTSPATRSVVVMAIVVQLAMNATMLRDPLDTRIRDVLAPSVVLLAFLSARAWRGSSIPARVAGRTFAVAVLTVAGASAAAVGTMSERLEDVNIRRGPGAIWDRAAHVHQVFAPPHARTGRLAESQAALVDYLASCSPADSRLFAMTFAPELFFYTGRGFAAGHVLLTPGFYVTERHSALMLERLAHEDVPFVIMDSDTRHELPGSYPRVVTYVNERYRDVGKFPVAPGKDFIVLADTARTPARTFGPQQLPCFTAPQS